MTSDREYRSAERLRLQARYCRPAANIACSQDFEALQEDPCLNDRRLQSVLGSWGKELDPGVNNLETTFVFQECGQPARFAGAPR